MHGHEYCIVVLVNQLHHFMKPSLVILHSHETSEHAYAMVYMDDVIPYIEGSEIVYRKLLAFLDASPYGDPVETVENFMIGIAAYPVIIVNESVMDILP